MYLLVSEELCFYVLQRISRCRKLGGVFFIESVLCAFLIFGYLILYVDTNASVLGHYLLIEIVFYLENRGIRLVDRGVVSGEFVMFSTVMSRNSFDIEYASSDLKSIISYRASRLII